MKQQQLRGQVGEGVARGVVAPGDTEMERQRNSDIEGERRQMQRVDPRDAAPEKSSRSGPVSDTVQILTGDDKTGDDEEQIHEQVEVPDVVDHEPPGGLVLEIIRVMQ